MPPDVLIVLDEAYAEFVTAPDAVDGLAERIFEAHPNVVVLRTFSKAYGLAGLRVGYAIGHPRVLDAARSTAIPLSVTSAAERAALASLDAEDELRARGRGAGRAPHRAARGPARTGLGRAGRAGQLRLAAHGRGDRSTSPPRSRTRV